VTKLTALFEAMKAETIPLGATLIEQERALSDDLVSHAVTPGGNAIGVSRRSKSQ
jgi:hypothetical protein